MMFFLKPVNISSVTHCKYLLVAALVSFWASFLSFFLEPLPLTILLFAAHVAILYLLVGQTYKLLVFLVLSGEGEGASPARANGTPADAPVESETPPIT